MVDIRPIEDADFIPAAESYAKVAAERVWIGGEPPIDVPAVADRWRAGTGAIFVVDAGDRGIVGAAGLDPQGRCGSGLFELGMWLVDGYRNKGLGSQLVTACIEWAKAEGAHKITLQVWPHNEAARALYRKFGFAEEGYLHKHWRRRNGELWDSVIMGLILDD
jgi:RimJ/RimL family protein N-acetyltransferase